MADFSEFLKILEEAKPYIKAGGEVAGAVSAGRAGGRAEENLGAQAQDRTAIDRYQAEQLAKLGGANLLEGATKDRADRFLTDSMVRAKQVGLGDLLANMQDVDISGLPSYIPHMQFTGGLRPSALGPNARQAGRNLSRQALEAQMSGADIPNLPDVSGLGTNAPDLTPLQHAGKLDTILNMLGYAGLGAGLLPPGKPNTPPFEASVPRHDITYGMGTPVAMSAALGEDPNSPAAIPGGRGNLIRAVNMLKQQQQANGGSYTGD